MFRRSQVASVTILSKVLYTATTHTTGGRDGHSKSDDGRLSVVLSPPGAVGTGTNPEQMFASGYSACFIGALKGVAGKRIPPLALPSDTSVDATVQLGTTDKGYGIAVQLQVSLPGLDKSIAAKLLEEAHQMCPYSNATRGNIPVDVRLK